VVLVEPGPVATKFTQNVEGLAIFGNPDDPYAALLQAYLTNITAAFEQAQSPQEVAEVVRAAATDLTPALRYQTSAGVTERAAVKLADPTGAAALAAARSRLEVPSGQ
jgi:hypothetical protein